MLFNSRHFYLAAATAATLLAIQPSCVTSVAGVESMLLMETGRYSGNIAGSVAGAHAVYAAEFVLSATPLSNKTTTSSSHHQSTFSWPAGLVGIDIDFVDIDAALAADASSYAMLPAFRISLLTTVSTAIATAAARVGSSTISPLRPTQLQIEGACTILAATVPWLSIRPCSSSSSSSSGSTINASSSVLDAHIGSGATVASDIILRDGRVGRYAFESEDTFHYRPYASPVLSTGSHKSTTALTWGAGLGFSSSSTTRDGKGERVVVDEGKQRGVDVETLLVTSESSELPTCTSGRLPTTQNIPGLFFPPFFDSNTTATNATTSSRSKPSKGTGEAFAIGPIASLLALRRNEWISAGLSSDYWKPIATHISISPSIIMNMGSASTPTTASANNDDTSQPKAGEVVQLHIAVAETAARMDVAASVPIRVSASTTSTTTTNNENTFIDHSELFLGNNDACEAHTLLDNGGADTKAWGAIITRADSSFAKAIADTCNAFNARSTSTSSRGLSAIQAWLHSPLVSSMVTNEQEHHFSNSFDAQHVHATAADILSDASFFTTTHNTISTTTHGGWEAQVCYDILGTGLHRELTYSITASAIIPATTLSTSSSPPSSSGTKIDHREHPQIISPSDRSSCHISIEQMVPESLYFDLDEVREQIRGGVGGGSGDRNKEVNNNDDDDNNNNDDDTMTSAVEGALGRAFSRFIDVEKPTSVSTQHVVLLSHAIHEDTSPLANRSPFGGATVATIPIYTRVGTGNDRDGDDDESSSLNTTTTAVLSAYQLKIHATFKELIHARYQAPGCAKLPRAEAAAAEAASAGCTTWRDVLSAYGKPNYDGSVYLTKKSSSPSSSYSSSSFSSLSSHDGIIQAADNGVPAGYPHTSGCYGLAHLPLPSVHIQCTPPYAPSASSSSSATTSLSLLAQTLVSVDGVAEGEWLPVPVINSPLSKRIGAASASMCTPPLAPVPIGVVEHSFLVFVSTAFATISGSIFVLFIAWKAKSNFTGAPVGGFKYASTSRPALLLNAPPPTHEALAGQLSIGLTPSSAASSKKKRAPGGVSAADREVAATFGNEEDSTFLVNDDESSSTAEDNQKQQQPSRQKSRAGVRRR